MTEPNMDIPPPKVLAIDTTGPFCAVGACLASRAYSEVVSMQRGQAEALFPLLEAFLTKRGWQWREIDLIAVGAGPGNFTGIRIGVSAARGLALSLGIPVIGISNFELLAGRAAEQALISLPAPRDKVYVQMFQQGKSVTPPRLIDPVQIPDDFQLEAQTKVFGHAANLIARPFGATGLESETTLPDPEEMAKLAEHHYLTTDLAVLRKSHPPTPLYIRAADAAPSRDKPPVLLDDT